jgi:flagellar biosynthesis/type III secretory pathway M-ring protein FliF/YscJ
MFKRLFAALQPPAAEPRRPRPGQPGRTLAQLEAEIIAELDAEAARSAPGALCRGRLQTLLQEFARTDPEAAAALVRSWMLGDR